MWLGPLLPTRIAETTTDADGRFEVNAKDTAQGISVEGGGGSGSAMLWCFSRTLLVEMRPYPPRDYAELNRKCSHSPIQLVTVVVGGEVLNPGQYILRASDSAWTAIAVAGGPTTPRSGHVKLIRRFGAGVTIHLLDWIRRAEAIGEPLLCDGDKIVVGSSWQLLIAEDFRPK
jgi:hypothetical protein